MNLEQRRALARENIARLKAFKPTPKPKKRRIGAADTNN